MRDTAYILVGLGTAILLLLAFLLRAMFFGLGLHAVRDKIGKGISGQP